MSQSSSVFATSWVFDDASVARRQSSLAASAAEAAAGPCIDQLCRSDLGLLTLEVVLARRAGDSIGSIAHSLGVSVTTVRRHLLAFVAWLESQDHDGVHERVAA